MGDENHVLQIDALSRAMEAELESRHCDSEGFSYAEPVGAGLPSIRAER